MSIHRYHPDPDKTYDQIPGLVLFEGCDRCWEHAKTLHYLDEDNFFKLWEEMMNVEVYGEKDSYRNSVEAVACRRLHEAYALARRGGMIVSPF